MVLSFAASDARHHEDHSDRAVSRSLNRRAQRLRPAQRADCDRSSASRTARGGTRSSRSPASDPPRRRSRTVSTTRTLAISPTSTRALVTGGVAASAVRSPMPMSRPVALRRARRAAPYCTATWHVHGVLTRDLAQQLHGLGGSRSTRPRQSSSRSSDTRVRAVGREVRSWLHPRRSGRARRSIRWRPLIERPGRAPLLAARPGEPVPRSPRSRCPTPASTPHVWHNGARLRLRPRSGRAGFSHLPPGPATHSAFRT